MQKNRLLELKKYTKKPTQIGIKLKEPLITQASQSIPSSTIQDDYSYCKSLINKLQNQIFDMTEMKKDYSRATKSLQEKQIMAKVNGIVKRGNNLINDLQKNVIKINEQFNKQKQTGDSSNAIMCADITRKANNIIKDYKQAQQKFTLTVRQTIKRQATIIKRQQLTEQQVDELVHNPQITQNMLKQKLLNAPSTQLQNAVSDIIDKCRDIVRLQKNVHECVQMIKQLAILTQIQADQINNIQVAIDSARDYVADGQTKLVNAKELYKKAQKKMCCIFMIVFAIVGVVLIPVLITKA